MGPYKIIYSDALGWKIQANLIKETASELPQPVHLNFYPYSTPKYIRILIKDTYGIGFPRRLSLVSSLSIAKSNICRGIVDFKPRDKVIFLGGNAAGLLAHAPADVSAVLVTDMTSALARTLFGAKFNKFDDNVEKAIFSKFKKIFAMSSACADSLRTTYAISGSKIEIYLPPTYITKEKYKKNLSGRLKIGFVGADFLRKGGNSLVSAYNEFNLIDKCELIIVSKNCLIENRPGITVYKGLDHKKIINEILPSLDLFCLPTTQDCSGIAIAEALAAGVPVITTDLPGIADLVSDGKTGFIVPVNDSQSIGKAIMRLVSDPQLRLHFSRNARQCAAEKFSAESGLKRLLGALG